jgi:hypothetical protein
MSRIKDLRNDEESSINLIDIIELFTPQQKSKYVDLLLKVMKATPNLKEHSDEIVQTITSQFDFISKEQLAKYNAIQLMWIYKFIDSFFNFPDLKKFNKFCEYNERGLIEQNDLSRYKDFETIIHQLEIAENKAIEKEMETQVVRVFEDSEWLLLRPLTFESSKKYGASTKWCTTTEHNPEYFNKYSRRGVLIYCICKTKRYKVASFYSLDKSEPEFSWWNEKDTRIDSLETELPMNLRELIAGVCLAKDAKSNDELSGKKDSKNNSKSRPNRIESALRRAQEEVMEEDTTTEVAGPSPSWENDADVTVAI